MITEGKRAVIYTRVSTEEQRKHGASLRHQEEQLRKYCDRKSIEVVGHYEDDESGKSFNRDNFTIMFDWVTKNKGRVDLVLVTRSDRFIRNLLEMLNIKVRLKALGVKLVAIEQERDDSAPESMIMDTLQWTMDELESKKISIRVKEANYKFAKEGAFLNTAPKGYKRLYIDERATLEPNDYAPTIHQIFTMFSEGIYSTEALRKKLGLNHISKQGFINILRNRTYTGFVRVPEFKQEKTHWVKGLHKPIISLDLFERVQSILNGKRISSIKALKKENEFFLRGHVICPNCQRPFTASHSKGRKHRYAYYHCDAKYNCNQRFTKSVFEGKLIELLDRFEVKKSVEKIYHDILRVVIGDSAKYRTRRSNELEGQLASLSQMMCSNEDLLVKREIDNVTFNRINNRYIQEQQAIESELTQAKAQPDGEFVTLFDKGVAFVKSLKKIMLLANSEDRSLILGSIFPKKLIFWQGEYRTTDINAFILLLCPSIKGFSLLENEKAVNFDGLSTSAPRLGLEPRTLRLTV